MTDQTKTEALACIPRPTTDAYFNPQCLLPYGLLVTHVREAMNEFLDFLGFINQQLRTRNIPRLERFLMPANFSSIVGEFMNLTLPKYCTTLVKNQYHNGHPDLIPAGVFPDDAVQHASEGIEVKASRHSGGWQGHNAEAIWLMVFYFDSNTVNDVKTGLGPKPFCFRGIYAAKLDRDDWAFSGRSATSRRTITASVKGSGVEKMRANWIYQDSGKDKG
jgi:hypothetical protein